MGVTNNRFHNIASLTSMHSTIPSIGIIGCGTIAAAHLSAYQASSAQVSAVSDISQERAEALATKIGTAAAYTDYLELLDSGKVNAVSICTPPHLHREIAIAALERGIHVLCEKPLAGTLEDSRAIVDAASASQACFQIAFRHRFLPAHQKMSALLASSELGKIVFFENIFGGPAQSISEKWFARRAISGGGVLMDTAIHGIDLFRFYCGEITDVSGHVDHVFTGTDVEDSAALVLKAESGAIGILQSSWNLAVWQAKVTVHTDHAALFYDYADPKRIKLRRRGAQESEWLEVEASGGFAEQTAHFLASIAAGTTPSPGVGDGLRAVEIIDGIYQGLAK